MRISDWSSDVCSSDLLVLLQKLYESVLQEHLPTGRISANHLKIWHRRWLGNVYAWAGHLRSVNMSKDGFRFAPAAQIPRLMKAFESEHLGTYTTDRTSGV